MSGAKSQAIIEVRKDTLTSFSLKSDPLLRERRRGSDFTENVLTHSLNPPRYDIMVMLKLGHHL